MSKSGPQLDHDEDLEEVSAVQIRPAAPEDVARWLDSLGHGDVPLLTVQANENYRNLVYGWCSAIEVPAWKTKGIRSQVVESLLQASTLVLSDLLKTENLIVQEPLRSMIDQKFYLISDLFRVLLEARFQVLEGADPFPAIVALTNWILGNSLDPQQERLFESAGVDRRVRETEQLDLVFFLMAVAAQSGVIDWMTVALDRVDLATSAGVKDRRTFLKELEDLAFGALRWEKLGSPVGVILGVERLPFLDQPTKLSKLLKSGVTHYQPV